MNRFFLLAFIWGWSYLFIKVAVDGMTPTAVAGLRVALGAAVLLAVLRSRGVRLPTEPAMWRHFAVVALFGSVLPFTMLAWGEQRITSALTAVLNASTPLFTALAAALYLGTKLRRIQAVGLMVGMAGVAVAAGVGGSDLANSSFSGSMASVLAGACYGISFAYMRRHLVDIPPLVAAAGQLVAATIVLAPFALATSAVNGIDLSPTRTLAIVLLGTLGTGLAYVLNYRVVAELGPTRASLVTYVIPVVAVAVGVVVLGEPFELRLLAGGVLIVAGIAAVHERLPGRRPRLPGSIPAGLTGSGGAVALVMVALVLGGCSGGGGDRDADPDDDDIEVSATSGTNPSPRDPQTSSTSCGDVQEEPLDPAYLQHVLPGAPEPTYQSDPPTSGPHQPGRTFSGELTDPISRPVQVGILEGGGVLVQHRSPLAPAEVAALAALDERVVIAPNPGLVDEIVATAWLAKQSCTAVDLDALGVFVADRAGAGPGTDG